MYLPVWKYGLELCKRSSCLVSIKRLRLTVVIIYYQRTSCCIVLFFPLNFISSQSRSVGGAE